MTPLERRIDQFAVALFSSFVFMLVAFNRGFVYLHLTVSEHPLYISEPLLLLMTLLVIFDRPRREALMLAFRDAARAPLFFAGLLIMFAMGKLGVAFARFGIEAVRHAALGYYLIALFLSCAFFSDQRLRRRLFGLIALASAVSTAFFISVSAGWFHFTVGLFRDFHGFGAFLWIGLVSAAILARGRLNLWTSRPATALLFIHCLTGFMLGGRSVFIGLSIGLGSILLLRCRSISRREWISMLVCALAFIACIGLRYANILTFSGQEVWRQSWQSYGNGLRVAENIRGAQPAAKLAPSSTAAAVSVAVSSEPPKDVVHYDRANGFVSLWSAKLNDPRILGAYSASENNVLWRLELWRLSSTALLGNCPVLGFPLGTAVKFYVFGTIMPGRTDLHNSHLGMLFRFGFVGFFFYAALMFSVLILFVRSVWRGRPEALIFLSGLLYLGFLASFNVLLEGPYGALTFWGFLGAGLASATFPAGEA